MQRLSNDAVLFQNLGELHATQLPRPVWLIEDLVPGDGFTVLAGRAKAGKSCLSIQIASALTRGTSFLGKTVVHPRRVLVVQCDCTPGEWQQQTRSIAGTDNIATLFVPKFWLGLPDKRAVVKRAIQLTGADFVILDALNSSAPTFADLNQRSGMTQIIEALQTLVAHPFLLIHHINKDQSKQGSDRIAGSHVLATMASGSMILDRQEETTNTAYLTVENRHTRLRLPLAQDASGAWQDAAASW